MKCGALILREVRGKKNPKLKIIRLISRALIADGYKDDSLNNKDLEVCDGNVKVKIEVESEYYGDYADCDCHLEVTYYCEKCGNSSFPELDNSAEFVESLVNNKLDTIDHDKLLLDYKDKQEAYKQKCADIEKEMKQERLAKRTNKKAK